ncbi:MAG TPA: cupredoxin domain-containing protein [Nevskiaceae bacterium]|nr:cupredoxin domain-containing protein [Nevskiaceae bacterium]
MSKKSKLIIFFSGIVLVVIVVAALLPGSRPSAKVTSVATHEAQIRITDKGFEPAVLTIDKKTTVTWVNATSTPHRVVSGVYPDQAGPQRFDSGKNKPLGPEGVFSVVFSKQGSYNYYDGQNPTVGGQIIVR